MNMLGAERGDLQINQLLTTYSGSPPYLAGAVSLVNEALVTDPNQQQIQQSLV